VILSGHVLSFILFLVELCVGRVRDQWQQNKIQGGSSRVFNNTGSLSTLVIGMHVNWMRQQYRLIFAVACT
jgi:hypothetical protein